MVEVLEHLNGIGVFVFDLDPFIYSYIIKKPVKGRERERTMMSKSAGV